MKTITDSDFEAVVIKADKPVIVDFYTDMCQPCKMMAPILEKLNEDLDTIDIVKFDAYEGLIPDIYQITSVPTLILFNEGEEIARREGSAPGSILKLWVEASLGS